MCVLVSLTLITRIFLRDILAQVARQEHLDSSRIFQSVAIFALMMVALLLSGLRPLSLVAGDEFGLAMFAADQVAMPPKLLARMAAANVPAPNWTITPGQGAIQLAAH